MPLLSRQLLWAIVISVAIHFLLVYSAELVLPDGSDADDSIEVTLVAPPALTAAEKPAPEAEPPKPAPKPKPRPRKPQPPPRPEPPAPPAPPPQQPPAPEAAPVAQLAPAPEPVAETPPEPAPRLELEPIPDEPVVLPPAPNKVDLDFELRRGKGEAAVGKVKQRFRLEDGGRYRLSSVAEASGLVSLFVPGKFEEHSEGLVTEQGLQPLNFRQARGKGKTQTARFDWEKHQVALEAGERKSSAEIADGTQDMLSFLYQFMFVPPLDAMRVTVANGRKLKTYSYAFEGEQQLETRIGTLRTVHISRTNSDGDEKTEVWLAQDYRHLPVKVRQTDKDGTVTEQLVTRLAIE